jgi:nitrite reductase (NO-forming)
MEKKYRVISVILVLAVIGIITLIYSSSNFFSGNTIKTGDKSVKEFYIESFTEVIDGKYYPKFSPNEITVNKGDIVRITIKNIKGTHDFKIDEFNVYSETPLDKEVQVEFVADKTGSFEYYCTKPGHRENGHWGTLKVM